MKFIQTHLAGAYIIEPEPISDGRGFFARAFCRWEFAEWGLETDFVQNNISWNREAGVLRGMHYQIPPHAEVKLVRCTRGAIRDVIIDLRADSATYCKWAGVLLTAENYRMLYVPRGFAHGYETLLPDSEVFYLVSERYAPQSERGVRWSDAAFNIEWQTINPIVSPKDASYPDFNKKAAAND
ncbi:MAG: dTDP-4-dehydrorhamnose 3,5-epimerase [Deltaproteobacteria bacterium]